MLFLYDNFYVKVSSLSVFSWNHSFLTVRYGIIDLATYDDVHNTCSQNDGCMCTSACISCSILRQRCHDVFYFDILSCCVLDAVPQQDGSNLSCSVPPNIGSSLHANVPNFKKKHRRIKSTSRGSDPCVDAGKCSCQFISLVEGCLVNYIVVNLLQLIVGISVYDDSCCKLYFYNFYFAAYQKIWFSFRALINT